MFNKLRNRFLLMNMIIISIIMLVAFAAIYTITYRDVRRDIALDLERVSETYRKPDGGAGMPKGGDKPSHQTDRGKAEPPAERSVSFELRTDARWNIVTVNSKFNMDDDFYALAVREAFSDTSDNGQFTLDGTRWAYSVQPTVTGYSLVYLDVTARQNILTNLIYTFSAVALVMLVAIYVASRYFANRAIVPVQEAFNKQKRFIADASHELKTPLAVINTNADVLLANSEDTIREQSKWLHHIKSETERMKTLTNDLLYLTEMDDVRERILHVPFDLSEAVESVILTMEAVIFEKNIELDYEIEPGLTVNGSSEQMKQVAMILLDNAVKYTNPGGSIELKLRKTGHHILLSVTNTGEGISAEHLGKIFDRFYRADPSRSRKHGGYGLGLAIAKSIVEQHRGKIYAKSVPNETTTFFVQLG